MIIETNNHSKVNSDSKHSTSLCADESNPIEVIRLSAQTFTDDLVEPNPLDTRPSILVSPPPTPTSPISSSSSSSTTTTTTTTKIVNDLSVVVAGENLDLITTELHSKSDDHRLEQQQQQKSDQADPSHHPVSSLDTTNTPLLHQNPNYPEDFIISSSNEDHPYCSSLANQQVVDQTKPDPLPPPPPPPQSQTSAADTSQRKVLKRKPSNKSGKSTKINSKPTGLRKGKSNSNGNSYASTVSGSPSSNTSLSIGNDCFKRFFLQRQVDGTFVIVPIGSITSTAASTKQLKVNLQTKVTNSEKVTVGKPVLILSTTTNDQNSDLMRIDKSNFILDPQVTHFTLTNRVEPKLLTPDNMSACQNGGLRSNLNHNYHQSQISQVNNFQQAQSRAILSALKQVQQQPHQSLNSAEIASSPPIVSSSSSSSSSSSFNKMGGSIDDSIADLCYSNSSYMIPGNQMEQNILVTSLPPVETIFNGDRNLMVNGSIGNLSQTQSHQPMSTELLGSFAPTTIIDDHHIDYYGRVDSTVDDEDELLANSKCLPYGYYYDDEKEFNKLNKISSLPSSTTSSPILDLADLLGSSDKSDLLLPNDHHNHHNHLNHNNHHHNGNNMNGNGNENFSIFSNDLVFDFESELNDHQQSQNHSQQLHSNSHNQQTTAATIQTSQPPALLNSQSLMTCDMDPLISGNDLVSLNTLNNKNGYIETMNMSTIANTTGTTKNNMATTFTTMADLNGQLFDTTQVNSMVVVNDGSMLLDNGHLYHRKGSPMINRTSAGPTLTQLNLQLPIKEEEEEDMDMMSWANGDNQDFTNVTLPRNSSLLACGNAVDLNGQQQLHQQQQQQQQQQQPQQQHMITSTSSPTNKTHPMMIATTNGLSDNGKSNVWFQTATISNGNISTQSPSGVSSSIFDDLIATDIDDGSLEIESILQQSNDQSLLNGANSYSSSPPKLSSSLQFKSPTLNNKKIKRPNAMMMAQNDDQKTLLGKLLMNPSPNINELLRENDGTNGPAIVVNQQPHQINLVSKLNNQSINLQSISSFTKPNVSRGKTMLNCPTLTALITSPSITNNVSFGQVSLPSPMITNVSTGSPSDMATILQQQNNRNRNNSMSTDYSVSSHDEGFASQPEEDQSESDDNTDELMLLRDPTDDIIDTDLYFVDNSIVNSINQVSINSNATNAVTLANETTSQSLSLTNDNVTLVNALNDGPINTDLTDLLAVKTEEEPMWDGSNTVNNHNQIHCIKEESPSLTMMVNQQQHHHHQQQQQQQQQQSQHYQQSKASTSSAIDDNESVDEYDDDDDESFYGDYDAADLLGATTSDDINNKWSLNMGRSRKGSEKRYFWQYNVQSKGPKGPRFGTSSVSIGDEEEDPHVFNEISDPVFSSDCQVEGVKHSGKARRGDGNDLTPNPKKLLMIGLELKKLSKTINDLTPVTEVPFTCRNKSRKEKNKLASRACRLKKKAQHEANKIKLHGLHREHCKLVKLISEIRKVMQLGLKMKETNKPILISVDSISYQLSSGVNVKSLFDDIITRNRPEWEVSGRTAEFVNHILDNVSAGVVNGGLDNL